MRASATVRTTATQKPRRGKGRNNDRSSQRRARPSRLRFVIPTHGLNALHRIGFAASHARRFRWRHDVLELRQKSTNQSHDRLGNERGCGQSAERQRFWIRHLLDDSERRRDVYRQLDDASGKCDGSVTVNTIPLSVFGNGQDGGWGMTNSATIPIGGSGSISFNGTSASGKTFSAGWFVDNFGQ